MACNDDAFILYNYIKNIYFYYKTKHTVCCYSFIMCQDNEILFINLRLNSYRCRT